MRKTTKIAFLITAAVVAVSVSGCGILMPYSSNLGPRRGTNQGYVGSVSQVYNYTLSHGTKKYPLLVMPADKPAKNNFTGNNYNRTLYYNWKNNLEMSIIGKRPTPIYEPPVILKVLMLPYVDKAGVLHSYQDVYFVVEKGRWLLGNYLNFGLRDNIFTPLNSGQFNAPATGVKNNPLPYAGKEKTSVGGFFGTGGGKKLSHYQQDFNNTVKKAGAYRSQMKS